MESYYEKIKEILLDNWENVEKPLTVNRFIKFLLKYNIPLLHSEAKFILEKLTKEGFFYKVTTLGPTLYYKKWELTYLYMKGKKSRS